MTNETMRPSSEDELAAILLDAANAGNPLEVSGNGSKRGIGHEVVGQTLSLSALKGILRYDPEEMVLSVKAGTLLSEVIRTLDERGQMLGFEPSSLQGMWEVDDRATIGGTIAAGIAGPRRFAIGGGRDHLLGFSAVNGRGERFKAGGSVVKNVTGYDLPKLAAGSFGTLFAMTELTLRVYPKAMETRALCFEGLGVDEGLSVLRKMRRSPLEPSGLSYLPAAAGRLSQTLCRFEGEAEGVAQRLDAALRVASHAARTLSTEECLSTFDRIANVAAFFGAGTSVWRVSVPPSEAAAFIASVGDAGHFADGAGSVVWVETDNPEIHGMASARGGHALLVRRHKGSTVTKDAFQPMNEPMSALVGRLKDAFDPCRVLNPGRMYRGI